MGEVQAQIEDWLQNNVYRSMENWRINRCAYWQCSNFGKLLTKEQSDEVVLQIKFHRFHSSMHITWTDHLLKLCICTGISQIVWLGIHASAAASSFLDVKISSAGAKPLWHGEGSRTYTFKPMSPQLLKHYKVCLLLSLSLYSHSLFGWGRSWSNSRSYKFQVTKWTIWEMVKENVNLHRNLKWRLNWD